MHRLWLILTLLIVTPGIQAADPTQRWLEKQPDQSALFNAAGFRSDRYRSPTPPQVEHATTLSTAQLQQLLSQQPGIQLINVKPAPWQAGQFIIDPPRQQIAGSHWLPNVGKGTLTAQWQNYLTRELARLSQGDTLQPLVFYCRSDCWMSWNAVKRAHALGYRQLYWYRDGTDGWLEADLPMEAAIPVPNPLM